MNLNSIQFAQPPPLGMPAPANLGSLRAIGTRLRQTREAQKLNQRQLCAIAGIATNTYNQWEKAKSRPEIDEAQKLCETLKYTLDWIYRGDASGLPSELRAKLADHVAGSANTPLPADDGSPSRAAKRGRR